jgi:glycosyltransferase involved in cell wall biosynthesis
VSAAPPLISVLLPTFNGARFLRAALDSLVAQQDPGALDVLAVDDGSTDATLAILEEYTSRLPLRLVEGPRAGNWVASTNTAACAARGSYVSLLHQDDLWDAGRLERLRRTIDAAHGDDAVLASDAVFVDERGRRLGRWRLPFRKPGRIDARAWFRALLVQNFIAVPAPLVRRDLWDAAGPLDPALPYTADWKMWLALASRAPLRPIPEPLCAFRVHPGSQTVAWSRHAAGYRAQLERVLEEFLPALDRRSPDDRLWEAVARFSIEANVAMAGARAGRSPGLAGLAGHALALGPRGLARYVRSSRVVERVSARLRTWL